MTKIVDKKIILKELRKNSRTSIRALSRKLNVSPSTVKIKIKELEDEGIIKGYVGIPNLQKMNLINAVFFAQCNMKSINKLKENPFVNSIFRISNHYNLLIEGIFPNIKEYVKFKNSLIKENVNFEEYFVTDEIKREEFLI